MRKHLSLLLCGLSLCATPVLHAQTLDEGFEGATFPPDGWTLKDNGVDGGTYEWSRVDYASERGLKDLSGIADGGKYTSRSLSGFVRQNNTKGADSWLITPEVTVASGDVLNFMLADIPGYNSNLNVKPEERVRFEVLVSEDGGATFPVKLWTITPDGANIQWSNRSFSLEQFVGKKIRIAFHDDGKSSGASPWLTNQLYIDNVRIDKRKASDAAVVGLMSPVSGCDAEQKVRVSLTSTGYELSSYRVCYSVDGSEPVKEAGTQPIADGDTVDYEFASALTMAEGMAHAVRVWVESDADPNAANDTIASEVKVGEGIGYPFTMTKENAQTAFTAIGSQKLGESQYIGWGYYDIPGIDCWVWSYFRYVDSYLQSGCMTLPKGGVNVSFDYMSELQGGVDIYLVSQAGVYDKLVGTAPLKAEGEQFASTEAVVQIPQEGNYMIALKPSTGFMGTLYLKNLKIEEPYDDVAVSRIVSPQLTVARSDSPLDVVADIANNGGKELRSVKAAFTVDGKIVAEDTIDSIPAGQTVEHKFSVPFTPTAGIQSVAVYAHIENDGNTRNDTLLTSILGYLPKAFPYKADFAENDGWGFYKTEGTLEGWSIGNAVSGRINFAKNGTDAALLPAMHASDQGALLVSPAVKAAKGKARVSFWYVLPAAHADSGHPQGLKLFLTGSDRPQDILASPAADSISTVGKPALQYQQGYALVDVPADGYYHLAFYAYGTSGDVVLDDVRFDRDEDLTVLSADNSAKSGYNLKDNAVSMTIANHGTTPRTGFAVAYSVGGELSASEIFSGTIQPGDTASYTFATKMDIEAVDTFRVVASVSDKADSDSYNNQWTAPQIVHYANITLPYDEDFDGSRPSDLWTTGGNWIKAGNLSHANAAYNGTGGLYMDAPKSSSGDTAFSGCMDMKAGTYDLSLFYRTFLNQSNEDKYGQNFDVFLTDRPQNGGTELPLMKFEKAVVSGKEYRKALTTFTLDNDGQYYLGIRCTSPTDTWGNLYIDQISIAKPEEGSPLTAYKADFAARPGEWYHYNPSNVFKQWTPTASGDSTVMKAAVTSYSWTTSEELPGLLASPAFALHKGDKVRVVLGYSMSADKPDQLSDDEKAKYAMTVCAASKDVPEAYTTEVVRGTSTDGLVHTADGEFSVPEDGVWRFGIKAAGPSSSVDDDVVSTYAVTYVSIANSAATGITSAQKKAVSYSFDGTTLSVSGADRVRLYGADGRLVRTCDATNGSVSMAGLAPGLYVAVVSSPDGDTVVKLNVR